MTVVGSMVQHRDFSMDNEGLWSNDRTKDW